MITQSKLKELLHYDPETGHFYWKIRRGRCRKWFRAGTLHIRGYRKIGINGHPYFEHKLAWLYMNGTWPTSSMAHINGIRDDNSINNLLDIPCATKVSKWDQARNDMRKVIPQW